MGRKKIIQNSYHQKLIPEGRLNDLQKLAQEFEFIENKTLALSKYIEFYSKLIERCINAGKDSVPVNFDYERKCLGLDYGFKKFLKSLSEAKFIQVDTSNFKTGVESYSYKPLYEELEIVSIEKKNLSVKTNKMMDEINTDKNLSEELRTYKTILQKLQVDVSIYNDVNEIIIKIKEHNYKKNIDKKNKRKKKGIKKRNNNSIVPINYSFVPYDNVLKTAVQNHKDSLLNNETGESIALPHYSSVPFKTIGTIPTELIPLYKLMIGKINPTRLVANSRVYSKITNLSRHFRPYLRLNNKPLIGFDIANSQPLLATIAFRRYSENEYGCLKQDVIDYQKACESGKFYEYFMELNDVDTSDENIRTEFKGKFFAEVFIQ